jgi:hypothetical protein
MLGRDPVPVWRVVSTNMRLFDFVIVNGRSLSDNRTHQCSTFSKKSIFQGVTQAQRTLPELAGGALKGGVPGEASR